MKMENNQEETFVEDRHYKIQCGKVYYVRKSEYEYNGEIVANYKIPVLKKVNNRDMTFYKKVRFKNGVDIKDNTQILILNMFEDVMQNKKDPYNPIWHIMITDFEVVEEPDDTTDAIMEYQNNIETKIEKKGNDDLITF